MLSVCNGKNSKGKYLMYMEEYYKNGVCAVDSSSLEYFLVETINK
jgi:hypothetical protein